MTDQMIFRNRTAFRDWLEKNYSRPKGLWLIFGKDDSVKTLTAEEALEEALCFGWIDGIIKRADETKYLKFFSPRRLKSKWSEKNRQTAELLISKGCMASPGRDAIERARRDGTWKVRNQRPAVRPEDIERFAELIAFNTKAAINFKKMAPSSRKLFAGFYLNAKQEDTRKRRLEKITKLLEENKKPLL